MKKIITVLTTLLLLIAGFTAAPALADDRHGPRAEVVSAIHTCCTQQMAECVRTCAAQPLFASGAPKTIWRVGLVLTAGQAVAATHPGFTTQLTPPPRT